MRPLIELVRQGTALLEDYGEVLDEEGNDFLCRVRDATQRMGRLIDDLLRLSRVTRREMRRERIDLTALARRVAEELRRAQPQHQVRVEIADGLEAMGEADLLQIALENLFDNAWKFTANTPRPLVELGSQNHAGEVVFVLRDNGAGFDMRYADKLFAPFQRLHRSDDYPGTGIGLATIQRIVRRHGGRIWAEAEVDRGAAFYFTL